MDCNKLELATWSEQSYKDGNKYRAELHCKNTKNVAGARKIIPCIFLLSHILEDEALPKQPPCPHVPDAKLIISC